MIFLHSFTLVLIIKLIMSVVPILDFSVIARGCQTNCTEEIKTTSYGVFSIKCCNTDFCNLAANNSNETSVSSGGGWRRSGTKSERLVDNMLVYALSAFVVSLRAAVDFFNL
jgi:hypothetical protein